MDYITIDTLQKLRSVGFSYPEYEHFLNYGMLYYYHGEEYLIGGSFSKDFSDQDKDAVQNGEWLPEASQLLSWLTNTDFGVNISVENGSYFSVQATDMTNGIPYRGGDYSLANALANVILKICKSNQHTYTPRTGLTLGIME